MGKYIKGYLIEQDVPMPKGKMASLAKNMSVGDSVLVENRSRSNALCAELRKLELQGASRSVKDGHRVWRVK